MRLVFVATALALVVVTAGCAGVGNGPGDGANETTDEQVTEPPVEETAEPTEEPTEAPPETEEPTEAPPETEEPTEAPPETEAPGGDGGDTDGDESNNQTLLLLGALAVFAIGFVAAGVLRGRNKSAAASAPPTATESTSEPQSDSERVISFLHKNNGRVFQDVLEEELDWSPSHTRRVVDGLVATGDVERRDTDSGWLVVFTDPDRTVGEE